MQIGPNPLLMGRHYPLDVAAQCELRDTLAAITEALARSAPRSAGPAGPASAARCARTRSS